MADWDSFAMDYDSVFLENPQYPVLLDTMLDMAEGPDDGLFIDVGCGTGNLTERLLERFPGARVLGVDPSEGMREVFSERFRDRRGISVLAGSATRLPVDDGLFDCAFSSIALHHVPPEERGRCASQLARVLMPGGTLVYGDLFCDVDGPPGDPGRCRDIIEKMTAAALYFLDHGAYELTLMTLAGIPDDLKGEGEYPTTVETWMEALASAGFSEFEAVSVPPVEIGLKVLRGVKAA